MAAFAGIDVEVAGTMVDYMGKPASQIVFRDISDRKRAEEELYRAKEAAEAQEE